MKMSYNPQSRHYSVLKKLFPLDLDGDLDVWLDSKGLALDRAEGRAKRLLRNCSLTRQPQTRFSARFPIGSAPTGSRPTSERPTRSARPWSWRTFGPR